MASSHSVIYTAKYMGYSQ